MVLLRCTRCGSYDTKLMSIRDYPRQPGSPFERRKCNRCGHEGWYNKNGQSVDERDTIPPSLWKKKGLGGAEA